MNDRYEKDKRYVMRIAAIACSLLLIAVCLAAAGGIGYAIYWKATEQDRAWAEQDAEIDDMLKLVRRGVEDTEE